MMNSVLGKPKCVQHAMNQMYIRSCILKTDHKLNRLQQYVSIVVYHVSIVSLQVYL
jgi:hypothetical protein